jgi:predicted PurR-regulated permease PerM
VKMPSTSHGDSRLLGVVTGIVVVAVLYFAKVVFVPLALALLLSFLLTPVVAIIERVKVPRGIAIFIVIASLVGVVGVVGWKTSQQFVDLTDQIPAYKKALTGKIQSLNGPNSQSLDKASATVRDLEHEISTPSLGSSSSATQSKQSPSATYSVSHPMAVEVVSPTNPLEAFENMLGPLTTAGIILVFTIFMLLDRENLRNRFIRVAGGGRLNAMTQALDEASHRINRYLLLQMLVNMSYGIIIGTGLYFIGIPNASLWGVVATVLRFLPYAGPPMAAAMPILLSLAIFDGWGHALETMGLFLILEIIVSNFIEPLLYGAHVGLSALAVLVAALFWTLLWGLPGLVLSTPLTVFLVVMGRYVPSLAFLNVLLGDEPVLPSHAQYYQRLLAMDENEAKHVLKQYLKEKPLEELYSTVVIPALSLAEQDRYRNELDEDAQTLMYQSIREMVEELGETSVEQSTREEDKPNDPAHSGAPIKSEINQAGVICIPARDDADDVIAFMLAQLLQGRGYKSHNIPIGAISDMLSQIADAKPPIICISALPPFAMSHARELYRRLRSQSSDMRVVICLWDFEGDLQKTACRFKMTVGDSVFSTLAQVLDYVCQELGTTAPAATSRGTASIETVGIIVATTSSDPL